MNPAIRVLYKEVLRQARQFDSHPVLKALASPARRPPEFSSLLGPAFANYVPSQSKSYTKAVREYFRKPIGPNESFTDRLNLALRAMRYLTSQKSDLMTAGITPVLSLPPLTPTSDRAPKDPKYILTDKLEPGTLLVSHPRMGDFFKSTVILICEHSKEGGTKGVAINTLYHYRGTTHVRLQDPAVTELFSLLGPKPVWLGGPVGAEQFLLSNVIIGRSGRLPMPLVFTVIHRDPKLEGAAPLGFGLFWDGNEKALLDALRSGQLSPEDVRLYCGYSGWAPDQLQSEIDQGFWIPVKPTSEFLFSKTEDDNTGVDIRGFGDQQLVETASTASIGAQKHVSSGIGAIEIDVEEDDDYDEEKDLDELHRAMTEPIASEEQLQAEEQQEDTDDNSEDDELSGLMDDDTKAFVERISDLYSPHTLWSGILKELGGEYAHFARAPKDIADAIDRVETKGKSR